MTKILFLPEVTDQFLNLVNVLYVNGYLSFKDVAIDYAETLFHDIQNTLPHKLKKEAPEYFDGLGKEIFYSLFPKNKHTTWYVFYSVHEIDDDTIYLIRHISNNHVIGHHLQV
jgi:hypothetical protein